MRTLSAYLGRVKGSFALWAASAAVVGSALIAVPVIARTGDDVDASAAKEKQTKVRVMDNFFDPRSTDVLQDERVSFVWKGSNRHNVRFAKVPAGASRKGSKIKREGRWKPGLREAGRLPLRVHALLGMRGTITVKPPPRRRGLGRASSALHVSLRHRRQIAQLVGRA